LELLKLYNSNIIVIKNTLDNPSFWSYRIHLNFPEIDYKFVPNHLLSFSTSETNSNNILIKLNNYNILSNTYKEVKYIIDDSVEESLRNPEEEFDYSQGWYYYMKSINDMRLLVPNSATVARHEREEPRIKLSDETKNKILIDMLKINNTIDPRDKFIPRIYINIGFNIDIILDLHPKRRRIGPPYDYQYEVDYQDIFNLLFHIYINGAHFFNY